MPTPNRWWVITRNGHPLDGTMRRTRKETIDNFLNRHPDAQITTWPTDWPEWQDWGYAVARITVEVQERKSHCEDDLEMVVSSPDPQSAPDIKMHIDNWGPGIAGKVVLAMDGGKIVASMALSDLLESCSPPCGAGGKADQ